MQKRFFIFLVLLILISGSCSHDFMPGELDQMEQPADSFEAGVEKSSTVKGLWAKNELVGGYMETVKEIVIDPNPLSMYQMIFYSSNGYSHVGLINNAGYNLWIKTDKIGFSYDDVGKKYIRDIYSNMYAYLAYTGNGYSPTEGILQNPADKCLWIQNAYLGDGKDLIIADFNMYSHIYYTSQGYTLIGCF